MSSPSMPALRRPEAQWMDRGACLDGSVDTELFFDGSGRAIARAIQVCWTCRVAHDCLLYALDNHEVGVWGGTSDEDRDRIRRRRAGRLL